MRAVTCPALPLAQEIGKRIDGVRAYHRLMITAKANVARVFCVQQLQERFIAGLRALEHGPRNPREIHLATIGQVRTVAHIWNAGTNSSGTHRDQSHELECLQACVPGSIEIVDYRAGNELRSEERRVGKEWRDEA